MASNGITARRIFHRIWIAGKKSLVKRAPEAPRGHEDKSVHEGRRPECTDVSEWHLSVADPTQYIMLKSYYDINCTILIHHEADICKWGSEVVIVELCIVKNLCFMGHVHTNAFVTS